MFSSLDRRACETVYADYQLKTPRQAQTAWRGGIEDVSEQRHTPELASQNTGVEIYPAQPLADRQEVPECERNCQSQDRREIPPDAPSNRYLEKFQRLGVKSRTPSHVYDLDDSRHPTA